MLCNGFFICTKKRTDLHTSTQFVRLLITGNGLPFRTALCEVIEYTLLHDYHGHQPLPITALLILLHLAHNEQRFSCLNLNFTRVPDAEFSKFKIGNNYSIVLYG